MDLSKTIHLAAFRAEVTECGASMDLLVWGFSAHSARLESRLDALYESVLHGLRSGVRAGFASLDPLASAMQAALSALRADGGFAELRVRLLLFRSIRLLEGIARDGFVDPVDLQRLRAESGAAALDAAWANHARNLWIQAGR